MSFDYGKEAQDGSLRVTVVSGGTSGGVTETNFTSKIGSLTETAPATDIASSGLNGRLQRIAQRLTTLITDMGDVADVAWTAGSGSEIALLKAIAAQAISTNPTKVYSGNSYTNVAAGTATTVIKSGAGTFIGIVINTKGASSNTLTVYDNTAGSGTKIAIIDTTTAVGLLRYEADVGTGITCVSATGTGADYTVIYR